jgi:hypothetical protein
LTSLVEEVSEIAEPIIQWSANRRRTCEGQVLCNAYSELNHRRGLTFLQFQDSKDCEGFMKAPARQACGLE